MFRVDHFLGKSTVLNLLGLRFANRIFEPLLSAETSTRVDIVFDEALGLEGRAGYYDKAGALVDMIQSHLLQVLALAAMEPPAVDRTPKTCAMPMAQVLRATRPWAATRADSRRARYTAGKVGGRTMPVYADEKGVDPARKTETLAEMTVAVDTWRWAGVPFRAALGQGARRPAPGDHLHLQRRPAPARPASAAPSRPARLRIGVEPGRARARPGHQRARRPLRSRPGHPERRLRRQ